MQRIRENKIFVAFTSADDARAWAIRVERFAHLSFVSDSSAFLTAAQISA